MTKKIPDYLDDPIDNMLYKLCEWLSPYFKATNHTPNMITTYSLLFSLIACYALYKGFIALFIIFFVISYFFDCFDVYFARKYKMTSKWGDIYDHTKDSIFVILIICIIFYKYKPSIYHIIISFTLFVMLSIHLGCQQNYYKNEGHDESLDFYKKFCKNKQDIRYTRFFGPGMFSFYMILLICWIHLYCKK